ncbi:uncharacterized protein LOC118347948 [Juglans regia]|uniref:Uncharacterized protein LOC118347948 n=1 Tax=Juglans regia TaxID=51240 RepID=A0A6P9EK31_JUGRE|nr:uncharacterized protein LOC118347948 [Juglans regia]
MFRGLFTYGELQDICAVDIRNAIDNRPVYSPRHRVRCGYNGNGNVSQKLKIEGALFSIPFCIPILIFLIVSKTEDAFVSIPISNPHFLYLLLPPSSQLRFKFEKATDLTLSSFCPHFLFLFSPSSSSPSPRLPFVNLSSSSPRHSRTHDGFGSLLFVLSLLTLTSFIGLHELLSQFLPLSLSLSLGVWLLRKTEENKCERKFITSGGISIESFDDGSLSPDSVLLTSKLQTILSRKEVTKLEETIAADFEVSSKKKVTSSDRRMRCETKRRDHRGFGGVCGCFCETEQ